VSELRRRSLRLALGLALVVLALLEVRALLHTLRGPRRLATRVTAIVRDQVYAARPRLQLLMLPGSRTAWGQAAAEVIRSSLASEVEVFERNGNRLFAEPRVSPIIHWPGANDLHSVMNDAVLVVGPLSRGATRLLSYLACRSGDQTVVMRLSTPMPELAQDMAERRSLLAGHGLALVVLAVAGALLLLPGSESAPPGRRALSAYEAAMEHLRDHGVALEESLREKDAMARAGELAAGIAHEVRNGLATILGYARLLERQGGDAAGAAGQIRGECEVLEGVVRRFMDYVQREKLQLAPFDLGRMLERVVAREVKARPGAEVALTVSEAGSLVGDEELLERAFENLVRNAREAAGPAGRVEVVAERTAGGVSVRVTDDGPGFPDDAPPEPKPFFTRKPGGVGLGLPLAHKIVRLHGGQLQLGAGQPRGAEIQVHLPVRPVSG
jgi:signal transduction histidine kinase